MFSQAQALDYLGSKLMQRTKGGFERRRKSKVRSTRDFTKILHNWTRFANMVAWHTCYVLCVCWWQVGAIAEPGVSSVAFPLLAVTHNWQLC